MANWKNLTYHNAPLSEDIAEVFNQFDFTNKEKIILVGSLSVESKEINSSGKTTSLTNVMITTYHDNDRLTITYTFFIDQKIKNPVEREMSYREKIGYYQMLAALGDIVVRVDNLADTTSEGTTYWSCNARALLILETSPMVTAVNDMAAIRDETLGYYNEIKALLQQNQPHTVSPSIVTSPVVAADEEDF